MATDQRTVLNEAFLKKDLANAAKNELLRTMLPFVSSLFILGMIALMLSALLSGILQTVIPLLLVLYPFVFLAYRVVLYVMALYKINHAEYTLAEDTLERIAEEEFNLGRYIVAAVIFNYVAGLISALETVFYFEDYGKVPVSKKKAEYSQKGDKFILVIYNGKTKRLAKIYSQRQYKTV